MAGLSIGERAKLARNAAANARRRGVARVLGSPLMRWRYGAANADALRLVPQGLRLADPSFVQEIASGSFGLAGVQASTGKFSPFDITPPSAVWSRELHGFGWLRHLEAHGTREAANTARAMTAAWIEREGRHRAGHGNVAFEPAVVGRRIISWLTSATMLLDEVDGAAFDLMVQGLVRQLKHLSATWPSAPEGYARLEALIGIVFGDLCIAGHERHLALSEAQLASELGRQILPDGGHVSRNTQVLVDLLLDLVPLRQCFVVLERPVPPAIDAAIARMMAMLRYMRLGDGALARFNGVGAPPIVEMGAVLAYDPQPLVRLSGAPQSRYARLERGSLVLIADTGVPPSLEFAGHAHAGCLAFELSAGTCAIFVNGGRPQAADNIALAAARSTASHNTVVLGDKSSARLMRHELGERNSGDVPLTFSGSVTSSLEETAEGLTLTANHEGYLAELGLVHSRQLSLAGDGSAVSGSEQIGGARGKLRLARDVPFALHFHLDWQADCEIDAAETVKIELADGSRWQFTATGAEVSLEPTTHYADPAGTVRSRQIVLRGGCFGETQIAWRLQRETAT